MPDIDGLEATRRIRAVEGDLRSAIILALTANVMESDEARCRAAGMNGLPFQADSPEHARSRPHLPRLAPILNSSAAGS